MKKTINKSAVILWSAALTALIGMTIYIVTSVTGYLAATAINLTPVICTIVAIAVTGFIAIKNENINIAIYNSSTILINVLLMVSFYGFIISRVSLAADVYFIPVNYPASEATALHISIVGAAFYLISYLIMIIVAFDKNKK